MIFFSPSRKMLVVDLQSGHFCFLPQLGQFTVQLTVLSFHSMLHKIQHELLTASLNNPQTNRNTKPEVQHCFVFLHLYYYYYFWFHYYTTTTITTTNSAVTTTLPLLILTTTSTLIPLLLLHYHYYFLLLLLYYYYYYYYFLLSLHYY